MKQKGLMALKRRKGADIKIDDKPCSNFFGEMKISFASLNSRRICAPPKKQPASLSQFAEVNQTWHII